MTDPLTTLRAILARENAALATLDTDAAAALLPAKAAAAAAFAAALAPLGPPPPDLADLACLATENRRLLERAIAAQQAVIGLIARAARAAPTPAPRYGAAGRLLPPGPAPVAIAASA